MLTPKEIATLLDGEGSICDLIQPGNSLPYPRISLGMTDPKYPNLMAEQFGGNVYLRKNRNPRAKDLYRWDLCGRGCEPVLMSVLPFLRIKKAQAEILLAMIATFAPPGGNRRVNGLSERDQLLRWKLHDILRELNRKGKRTEVNIALDKLEDIHA